MGYDWKQVLPAVFYDTGAEAAEMRHSYRKCVAESYRESFFQPYQKWCRQNNLKLTGHLLLEEGLYTNTIFQGNFVDDLSLLIFPGQIIWALVAKQNMAVGGTSRA